MEKEMAFALLKKSCFLEALIVYIGQLYMGWWNLMHKITLSTTEVANKQLLS